MAKTGVPFAIDLTIDPVSASHYRLNYSLEADNKIESPVVNMRGMDCWTYYENALAISRMLGSILLSTSNLPSAES